MQLGDSFRAVISVVLTLLLLGCSRAPSPAELQRLTDLRASQASVRQEIAAAKEESGKYSGGVLAVLIKIRLEILRTTEALLQQRIVSLEGGGPVTVQVLASKPDPERAEKLLQDIRAHEVALKKASDEAAQYNGGLIQVVALTKAATEGQTIATLSQSRLVALYGLNYPTTEIAANVSHDEGVSKKKADRQRAEISPQNKILLVKLLRMTIDGEQFKRRIAFDLEYSAAGLDRTAKAIKGTLHLNDLFGETIVRVNWTIDTPTIPGSTTEMKSFGFKYNEFDNSHQQLISKKVSDLAATFVVSQILF